MTMTQGETTLNQKKMNHLIILQVRSSVLSIRAGSRPKQPATGQCLAGYFLLTLLLILVRNLK